MEIVEILPPTNGGTLYVGRALSVRNRRYSFCATVQGEACAVYREDAPRLALPDGRRIWRQLKAPPALADVVRRTMRELRGRRIKSAVGPRAR